MRTDEIPLTGTDLSKVRREVDDLLAAVGGTVDREETTTAAEDGRVDRSLTSSTESAKDVTTEVIDTAERVQTLRNSLERSRATSRTRPPGRRSR